MKQKTFGFVFSVMLAGATLVAYTDNQKSESNRDESKTTSAGTVSNDQLTQERLRRFDSLDFQYYNNQQWDSFAISHADNIKVYYPDGTITTGLYPEHINMLTPLFAFAPDTKITRHPVSFGNGEWTAVVGEMEGTFSKPMDMGNGKVIQPTGKKFKLSMSTIARWKDDRRVFALGQPCNDEADRISTVMAEKLHQ